MIIFYSVSILLNILERYTWILAYQKKIFLKVFLKFVFYSINKTVFILDKDGKIADVRKLLFDILGIHTENHPYTDKVLYSVLY